MSGFRNLNIFVRKYRGNCDATYIKRPGFYRYRLVKNSKKTQWRTINIMRSGVFGFFIK